MIEIILSIFVIVVIGFYLFGLIEKYYIYPTMYTINPKINDQISLWLVMMFCLPLIIIFTDRKTLKQNPAQ